MHKPLNGIIHDSRSRIIAVYDEKNKVLHTYYGLTVTDVDEGDGFEGVVKLVARLRLESGPLDQFKALLEYRSSTVGSRALDSELMNWGRNMGLSPRGVSDTWVGTYYRGEGQG